MTIDYRKLKDQVRLKDLLAETGWQSIEGRGEQLRGPCPLPACQSHRSNKPSRKDHCFSVHQAKNIYHCFRCGSSGSVLDFWKEYRGTTLYQAALELGTLAQPAVTQPHLWSPPTHKS